MTTKFRFVNISQHTNIKMVEKINPSDKAFITLSKIFECLNNWGLRFDIRNNFATVYWFLKSIQTQIIFKNEEHISVLSYHFFRQFQGLIQITSILG